MTYDEIVNEALANVGCTPKKPITIYKHIFGGILSSKPRKALQYTNVIPDGKLWYFEASGARNFVIQMDGQIINNYDYKGDCHLLPDLNHRFTVEKAPVVAKVVKTAPTPAAVTAADWKNVAAINKDNVELKIPSMTIGGVSGGKPVKIKFDFGSVEVPKAFIKQEVLLNYLGTKVPLMAAQLIQKYKPTVRKKIMACVRGKLNIVVERIITEHNKEVVCQA